MALETIVQTAGCTMSPAEEQHLRRHLRHLEGRLVHEPAPVAEVKITALKPARQFEVDLRVRLTPLGGHLISHQSASTLRKAVRLAVDDVERQLERRHAHQSGEPTFGVPSRRLPAASRPAQFPGASREAGPEEAEEP